MTFLERQVVDLSFIYENFEYPDEFLRDPSYWMNVEKMESFLFIARHYYEQEHPGANFLEEVAHECHDLRAWGALDSVLKIMSDPVEIFAQPSRMLSYFVSPDPSVSQLVRESRSISFQTDLSHDDYPLICTFLSCAFEALPKYAGQELASASWVNTKFQIEWAAETAHLFADDEKKVSPDLLQSVITSLQESQKALENKNRELVEKNAQLEQSHTSSNSGPEELRPLSNNLQKMKDYFTRANQLITLLIGQNRMDRQVKEAMRRVDWDHTHQQFPRVIEESLEILRQAHIVADSKRSKNV